MPNPTVPNANPQYGDGLKREQVTQAVPLPRQSAPAPAPQGISSPPSQGATSAQDPYAVYQDPLVAAIAQQPAHIQVAEWQARTWTRIASDPESSPETVAAARAAQDYLGYLMEGGEPYDYNIFAPRGEAVEDNKSEPKKESK